MRELPANAFGQIKSLEIKEPQPPKKMKIFIFIVISIGILVLQSFGQGQVIFANSSVTKIWVNSNGPASTTTGVGTVMPSNASEFFTFALFAYYTGVLGSSTNSTTTPFVGDGSSTPFSDPNWELVAYGVNGVSGRISDTNSFETVPNIPSADYATLKVIGWNTSSEVRRLPLLKRLIIQP